MQFSLLQGLLPQHFPALCSGGGFRKSSMKHGKPHFWRDFLLHVVSGFRRFEADIKPMYEIYSESRFPEESCTGSVQIAVHAGKRCTAAVSTVWNRLLGETALEHHFEQQTEERALL